MKRIITLCLWMVLPMLLTAQQDSSVCKIITTTEGKELIVEVDTVSKEFLIYDVCFDNKVFWRRMRLKSIKSVRPLDPDADSLVMSMTEFVKEMKAKTKKEDMAGEERTSEKEESLVEGIVPQPEKKEEIAGEANAEPSKSLEEMINEVAKQQQLRGLKKWIFKKEALKLVKSIEEGQKVKVYYLSMTGRTAKTKGYLKSINEEEVVVRSKRGVYVTRIPKARVQKIRYYNSELRGLRIAGYIALGVGGLLAMISLVLLLGDGLGIFLSVGQSDPNLRSNLGCLWPILALAIGIGLIFAPRTSIKTPFSGAWEITETQQEASIPALNKEP